MKKTAFIAATLALASLSQLQADPFLFEMSAAYFYPTNSRFRDIYSEGVIYTLEIDRELCCQLHSWTSVSYFHKSGHFVGTKGATKIDLVPVGFGLKYIYYCDRFHPYLAIGPVFTYMKIDNNSPFFIGTVSQWGFGGIFKAGVQADFCNRGNHSWSLDFFASYSHTKIDFDCAPPSRIVFRNDADLSHLSVGGGLILCF